MIATVSAFISVLVRSRKYIPDAVAISVASFVQSAKVPPSLLTSESRPAAPVTKSPSASRIGKLTRYATFLCGTGRASVEAINYIRSINIHAPIRHVGIDGVGGGGADAAVRQDGKNRDL